MNADGEICQLAAYCHDLGRVVEMRDPSSLELGNTQHAEDSVSEAEKLLASFDTFDYPINLIADAISVHSDKLYQGESIIAKVLRDSDKRDALGSWGRYGKFVIISEKILFLLLIF